MTEPATQNADPTASESAPEHDLPLLIEAEDAAGCTAWMEQTHPRDSVYVFSKLSDEERSGLLGLLGPEPAAELLGRLPEYHAVEAIEELDTETAADIIEELPSDERADLINALDEDDADAILDELDELIAAEVRKLASYDDDVTGSLMSTEYVSFREHETVRDLLNALEADGQTYADYSVQYTYIVDDDNKLLGVVPVRRLLLSKRATPLRDIMIADPVTVTDTTPLDETIALFERHSFLGFPIVDETGRMVGVVERGAAEDATTERSDAIYLQSQGIVGGEELRSMPLLVRSRRRLAWLSINIVLNIIAASVIALHQDTLEAVIALAVFLPIISDMSGCSGNQAVAVSMRELTLGVTRPTDIARVLIKECSIGILNGLALGLLIGLVAFLWQGNAFLGGVVGVALMANTIVAVCIGGAVPLILKGLKVDPALAAGPILTTITDMCGFMLVLSLASLTLSKLT
jgi:magnesium transporter